MIEISCNLCRKDDWRVRFPSTMNGAKPTVDAFRCTSQGYGDHAQIVQCRHCGLVYANPRWPAEELIQAYTAVEDEIYQKEREGRERTFARHLQELERRTGPANGRSLLDVGAYIGVFVEAAAAAGWDATGVEPSAWAVDQAQAHGLNVIQGTLDVPQLQGRQFAVITMWDVIEHFDDPSGELAKAYTLLSPGGWLVIHTMDIDSPLARLMGRRWPWLMDMHLYYFSQESLSRMLTNNGFKVVKSGAQGRYLRLGYLATRVGGFNRKLGRRLLSLVVRLGPDSVTVPVNLGNLFTVYARRPK